LYYPLGYKPALDGLRAFAILPVLLFHGGAPGFRWGYIGVDVFFVISGYLITSILLNEYVRRGKISFLAFYRRRALRLLPALVVVCLSFFCLSCVVLKDPKQAAQEVAIVLLYVANWTRALDAGVPKALGHTWSLSIEEQFYTAWPLVVLAILSFKSSARFAFRFIVALALAVACWRACLAVEGISADRLYFGTDTRADALLIGAGLAFALATPGMAVRLESVTRYLWIPAAILVIALPAIFPWFDRRMFYAGFGIVALSAATILAAALYEGFLARVLGSRTLVWIGKRSYGLYLWHYPIMLLCLLQFRVPDGVALTLIEATASLVLAALSYEFIERPFLQLRYSKLTDVESAQFTPSLTD
jgi:peptidoglycan/LPS O-acetylase OafA/YrhL